MQTRGMIFHIIFKTISNYYPQNLMHDRRVARGSTYAAMIVPGGLNPDAMFQSVKNTTKTKKRTVIVRFFKLK